MYDFYHGLGITAGFPERLPPPCQSWWSISVHAWAAGRASGSFRFARFSTVGQSLPIEHTQPRRIQACYIPLCMSSVSLGEDDIQRRRRFDEGEKRLRRSHQTKRHREHAGTSANPLTECGLKCNARLNRVTVSSACFLTGRAPKIPRYTVGWHL